MWLLLLAQVMLPGPGDLLTIYQQADGDRWRKARIESPAQWERKRSDIRARVFDIMGRAPASDVTLAPQILSRDASGACIRIKVHYAGGIPAWLLVPKGPGPFPAVLAAHQTQPEGKDRALKDYGDDLAARGFVVLAPDSITAGERVLSQPFVTEAFDRANPEWSAMGKMLADHRRGIDYLASLPDVDAGRIAAIGHSLGGYNAFFLAAFDERVKATVVSCGFTPMGGGSKPFAWARAAWFVHFPRLAPYLRAGVLPFDMPEVMALVAPRALFNYSAAQDRIFPDAEAIRAAAAQVESVYGVLGARERFVFRMTDGPHDFPENIRREAYAWLERELSR